MRDSAISARRRRGFIAAGATLPFALLLLAGSCREPAPSPAAEVKPAASTASPAASTASAAPTASAPATAAAAKPPSSAASAQPADIDPAIAAELALANKLYAQGLGAGRKAVKAKDWPAAIAAFDKAVNARKGDARARAERGFARLLAGDTSGAKEDLESASALAADDELSSQIWFNLGLLHEKQSEDEDARVAFATANLLRKSKAAAAKLAGKSTCPVVVQRTGLDDLATAANFREAYAIVEQRAPDGKDEGEAMRWVCRNVSAASDDANIPVKPIACEGDEPWSVTRNYYFYQRREHLIFADGKKMFIYDGGMTGGWASRCTGFVRVSGVREGGLLHTTMTFDGADSVLVTEVGEGGPTQAGTDTGCIGGVGWAKDDFYDGATGKGLLRVQRLVPKGKDEPSVQLKLEGRTVVLTGEGCNERIAVGKQR